MIEQSPEKTEHETAGTILDDRQFRLPPQRLRSLADILADLKMPPAPKHLMTKKKGGALLWFIPWYYTVQYLDLYAPGWCHEVKAVNFSMDRIVITVRISIPTADGWVHREATGTEEEPDEGSAMYGDPSSNAEAMALKRAAAKFGFGLYLYDPTKR